MTNVWKGVSAARVARQELGAGLEGPLPDALRLVEGPGAVPVTIAELPDGMAGALQLKRGRPFILLNGRDDPARQRFTLAHEYGHWRLGHGEVVDGQDTISGKTNHPDEVQANSFAGEFLVPEPAVAAWMQARDQPTVDLRLVVEMAVEFGVSALVARIRLEAARYLVDGHQNNQLKEAIRGRHHRNLLYQLGLLELQDTIALAQPHLPRLPAQLRANAMRGYERGVLDIERLASLLRQDPADIARELEEHGITTAETADDEPDY